MQKLQVLRKLEDWLTLMQPSLNNFPKTARFSLAQRMENTSLECIDLVITANLDKARRIDHLLKARVATERLQILVRVARQRSFIDIKHYELFSERITEISKMLSGWSRVTK